MQLTVADEMNRSNIQPISKDKLELICRAEKLLNALRFTMEEQAPILYGNYLTNEFIDELEQWLASRTMDAPLPRPYKQPTRGR